jgi:hypothetical protein
MAAGRRAGYDAADVIALISSRAGRVQIHRGKIFHFVICHLAHMRAMCDGF